MVNYPAQLDTTQSLPTVVDNKTPVQGAVFNKLRDAVLAIESALGTTPFGVYATVGARLTTLENNLNNFEIIKLTGDLGGNLLHPLVVGLQGRPVSNAVPSPFQFLSWNGISWGPANIVPGGDVTGTYPNFTVTGLQNRPVSNVAPQDGNMLKWVAAHNDWEPGIVTSVNGASVPAAGSLVLGNVLQVTGPSSLGYGPINLGGGVNYVVGVLPTINQANQALVGDVNGTTGSNTVTALQHFAVKNQSPTNGQVLTWVGVDSKWEPVSPLAPGAGLTTVGSVFNVGQNADNTIQVNAHDVQLNPNFYTPGPVINTLVQRDSGGGAFFSTTNGGTSTYVGGTQIQATAGLLINAGNVLGLQGLGGIFLYDNLSFDISVSNPIISQTTATGFEVNGQPLTIQAQNASGAVTVGGDVVLQSGTGTVHPGFIDFYLGASLAMQLRGPGNGTALQLEQPNLQFDFGVTNPTVTIVGQGSNAACNTLTIAGQTPFSAATGTNRNPGQINLSVAAPSNGGIVRGQLNFVDNNNPIITIFADSSQNGYIDTVPNNSLFIRAFGNSRITLNSTGIGFFGATPISKPTLTGALSSVTDANAKAVLTSIANALISYGLTFNSMT